MSIKETVVNENHAQEILQTMYDGEAGAGYVKFCNCPNGGTTSLMDETSHSLLYDWDETGSHVTGLEILRFPEQGFREGALGADLIVTELSEQQKEAILNRFIKNSN